MRRWGGSEAGEGRVSAERDRASRRGQAVASPLAATATHRRASAVRGPRADSRLSTSSAENVRDPLGSAPTASSETESPSFTRQLAFAGDGLLSREERLPRLGTLGTSSLHLVGEASGRVHATKTATGDAVGNPGRRGAGSSCQHEPDGANPARLGPVWHLGRG